MSYRIEYIGKIKYYTKTMPDDVTCYGLTPLGLQETIKAYEIQDKKKGGEGG